MLKLRGWLVGVAGVACCLGTIARGQQPQLAPHSADREFRPGQIIIKYNADRVRVCPVHAARSVSRGVAVKDVIPESLERINSRHKLRLEDARKAFGFVPNTGNLAQDRLLARDIFETTQSPHSARIGHPSSFVDLSSIYIVPCQEGHEQSAVAELNMDPSVLYAEVDRYCYADVLPNDTYVDPDQDGEWSVGVAWYHPGEDLWGLSRVGADQAWSHTGEGAGVVVAIVDTGIDYNHTDCPTLWTNEYEASGVTGVDDDTNGYVDDIRGYDFYNDNAEVLDDYGHGTHCAGTVAAPINGSGVVGVAPRATIMPLKALDNRGRGYTSSLAAAVVYAANNGADIISNSWGGLGSSAVISEAFAYARELDCVCVASAGNEALDVVNKYPANIDTVLAVSATDYSSRPAWFSGWGSRIDVAAPGVEILSLRAAGTDFYGNGEHIVPFNVSGGEYYLSNGTSMACPHVSGEAALILAEKPLLTEEDVRRLVRRHVTDLGPDGFDVDFGHGLIDIGGVAHFLIDCNSNNLPDEEEIVLGTSSDCNGNDVPDECDLRVGISHDCNSNSILDECDIMSGNSNDCNGNAIPDECAAHESDCNTNGVPDECDIGVGWSEDDNDDGVPDECQRILHAPSTTYPTIQSAIDAAHNGDIVVIHDGTHTGLGNKNLEITDKVITLRSQNGPEHCIIDCEGSGRGLRVANNTNPSASPTIWGLTIRNGFLQDNESWGGGIFCEYSSPTVTNCVIENNTAGAGGGIYCEYSNPTISYCRILNNSAHYARFREWSGGGILCLIGAVTIDHCEVLDNTVSPDSSGVGGIGVLGGPSTISNCLISGNSAVGWLGGGLRCRGGDQQRITVRDCVIKQNSAFRAAGVSCEESVTISSCTITENYSTAEDGMAGGIWCGTHTSEPPGYAGRRIHISDCLVSANIGQEYGGGIVCFQTSPTIERCQIVGNRARRGGGIYVAGELFEGYGGPTPHIKECTIDGNIATCSENSSFFSMYGGGVYCSWSSPIIELCQIINNQVTGPRHYWSDRNGGGLAALGPCSPTITNCVIANNRAEQGAGGGLYFEAQTWPEIRSNPEISLTTISDNHAIEGGGICCRYQIDTKMNSTIVSDNSASSGSQLSMRIGNPTITLEYSDLLGGVENAAILDEAVVNWGDGNITTAPRFRGGPEQHYSLSADSPCINLGAPDIAVPATAPDIAGNDRITFHRIDIGAYEAQLFSDCNMNRIPDGNDIVFGTASDCNENGLPDLCDLISGTSHDCDNNSLPDECDIVTDDCNTNSIPDRCDLSYGTSLDIGGNGIPDECEPDCNSNAVADSIDIHYGLSKDCNDNQMPDECEPQTDCNENAIQDICEIGFSTEADCDGNGVLDICELHNQDCNSNGVIDACDIESGTSSDCNVNGIPDRCDLRLRTSLDCTSNGIPDECESDCNTNGLADSCDIAAGTSVDADNDGVPDECVNAILVPWQYETIQEAIDAAHDNDRVLVSSGIYTGEGNIDLDFRGKKIRLIGQPHAGLCVIDCKGAGRGIRFHNGEKEDSVLRRVTIRGGVARFGGGILCERVTPTIDECVIELCNAEMGGGLYCYRSAPTLLGTSFRNNKANAGQALGGAICCEYWSFPAIIDGEFANNSARSGGAIANDLSSPTLLHSILVSNEAAEDGGAIFNNWRSRPLIVDCVLTLNQSEISGGVVSTRGPSDVDIRGCTIAFNQANDGGAVLTGQYATSEVTNSILWGDSAADGAELAVRDNGELVVSHTLVGGGRTGVSLSALGQVNWHASNIDQDPRFQDADGPDDSLASWEDNNLRLHPASPCVDAGSNGLVLEDFADLDMDGDTDEPTPFDYDGNVRIMDGNEDGQATLDLGAFELTYFVDGDLDGDRDVDSYDYAIFIASFGRTSQDTEFNPACDYDGDGVITLVDYQRWMAAYREYVGDPLAAPPAAPAPNPSDYDMKVMTDCINGPSIRPRYSHCLELFDFDGDADVDLRDFAAIQSAAASR